VSWKVFFPDQGASARITYDELVVAARKSLRFTRTELSDDALKALYCALDGVDGVDNNALQTVEFARFMKRAGQGTLKAGRHAQRMQALRQHKVRSSTSSTVPAHPATANSLPRAAHSRARASLSALHILSTLV
jgi:hypothetical protein